MELDTQLTADAGAAAEADSTSADVTTEQQPRDYEADARRHGWTPKDEFKGDPARWVDAETFAKRADEVMPFLKKKAEAQDREIADLKKTIKRASEHFTKVEERAYQRALADLEAKHADAVESGDVAGAKRIVGEMRTLEQEAKTAVADDDPPAMTEAQAAKDIAEWVEENDWYVTDDAKRRYADIQAASMGKAMDWKDGPKAWLEELGRRVDRKFADKKPSPVNGGGNRGAPSPGGKTYNDLPAPAKAMCDKWHRQGVFGDPKTVSLADARKRYVETYQWD